MSEPRPDPSDCPVCGEWRDAPDADCASCGSIVVVHDHAAGPDTGCPSCRKAMAEYDRMAVR